MADIITLEVKNRTELENLARSRGFDTIQAYLLALIEDDLSEPRAEDTALSPTDRFRQGWREALSGHEGIPYDEMWKGIEGDDEG